MKRDTKIVKYANVRKSTLSYPSDLYHDIHDTLEGFDENFIRNGLVPQIVDIEDFKLTL